MANEKPVVAGAGLVKEPPKLGKPLVTTHFLIAGLTRKTSFGAKFLPGPKPRGLLGGFGPPPPKRAASAEHRDRSRSPVRPNPPQPKSKPQALPKILQQRPKASWQHIEFSCIFVLKKMNSQMGKLCFQTWKPRLCHHGHEIFSIGWDSCSASQQLLRLN